MIQDILLDPFFISLQPEIVCTHTFCTVMHECKRKKASFYNSVAFVPTPKDKWENCRFKK